MAIEIKVRSMVELARIRKVDAMTPEIRVRILMIEALVFGIGFPVLFSLLAIARG